MKIRVLAVLGACVLAAAGLTGCDSKIGTAADVNGSKISESDVSSYLTSKAQPLTSSNGGGSIAPRTFVLQYLIGAKVYRQALEADGTKVTDQDLAKAKAALLQGGSEQQIIDQVNQVGLASKFEPAYLENRELYSLLGSKFQSQADFDKVVSKFHVSVNPRYGSWDNKTLTLTDLSSKQLPSFVTYDQTFPGDAQPTQ